MKNILIILILFWTIICIPTITSAQVNTSNKYAVIIGNDARQGSMPVTGSSCAKLLKRMLMDAGFASKNIKVLLNKQSTLQACDNALAWLSQAPADSEIVFAIFGHGGPCGCAVYGGALTHTAIRDLLAPSQSQKQLIIVDTCGSAGAIIPGIDGATLCAPNRIVATAGSVEEESSIPTAKYTEWVEAFLINDIIHGGADLNGDGKVSIQEAYKQEQTYLMWHGLMCDNYGQEFFL
jgi:hypothetical protein